MKYQIKIVKPANNALPPAYCPYMIDGAEAPK
jgi:hypothetical protein